MGIAIDFTKFTAYRGYIYIIVLDDWTIKVGGTKRPPDQRFMEHANSPQLSMFPDPKLGLCVATDNVWALEHLVHRELEQYAIIGQPECFACDWMIAQLAVVEVLNSHGGFMSI